MKINLRQMEGFSNAYTVLEKNNMNFSVAYKLIKIKKNIEAEINSFYSVQLSNIIQEYSQKDSEGNVVYNNGNTVIAPSKKIECEQKLNELYAMEIDIEDINFELSEFDGIKITPEIMEGILPFIKKDTL